MRINYLNNKDLLKEIHKSKVSYSSFVDDEYKFYDVIVPSLAKINTKAISEARKNRAARLAERAWQIALEENPKVKLADFKVSPRKIEKTDLIFRVMMWDHVPLAPGRKRSPKTVSDNHAKVNFPPYQHYKFNEQDELVCVGKSHWIGGMENGYFSVTHGKITPTLARMFLKLCERYSSRGNWRGYTYVDEMRGQALLQLSQVGLQFDESKSSNPFAYLTAILNNSFTRVLNTEKRNQNIRDDILEMNNMSPSYTRQGENSGGSSSE